MIVALALAAEVGVHHPNLEEGCTFRPAACHLAEDSNLAYRWVRLVDNFQDPSDTCRADAYLRPAYSGTGCSSPYSFDICVVAPSSPSGPGAAGGGGVLVWGGAWVVLS